MSAQTLRDAAARLREMAKDTNLEPPLPWHSALRLMGDGKTTADAKFIAAMTPDVALALADWLDSAARDHEIRFAHAMCDRRALEVARLILGGAA